MDLKIKVHESFLLCFFLLKNIKETYKCLVWDGHIRIKDVVHQLQVLNPLLFIVDILELLVIQELLELRGLPDLPDQLDME
jgi:hypothetical protein